MLKPKNTVGPVARHLARALTNETQMNNRTTSRQGSRKSSGWDVFLRPKPLAALFTAIAVVLVTVISTTNRPPPTTAKGPESPPAPPRSATTQTPPVLVVATNPSPPSSAAGRLEGWVKDRAGNSISDLLVSVRHGPETKTDRQGHFVLNNLSAGDQDLVIAPPSQRGQVAQHITIQANLPNQVTIVYDAQSSRLGLLSTVAPVDGSLVEVGPRSEYRFPVRGRCDGLGEILDRFEVWVLVRSELDERFWVQRPPAVVDPSSSTWVADVRLGDSKTPPSNGERWYLVVVAAAPDSGMGTIVNTPLLSALPAHIRGNVVTLETTVKP